MRPRGFVVRFVDVVLILLFGFISISNIRDTDVALPQSTEVEPVSLDVEEVFFVGVMDDGAFLIEQENRVVHSINELRDHINRTRRRQEMAPMKVRIRSSKGAAVRHAFAVAALCDDLGLEKTLEVELDASDL